MNEYIEIKELLDRYYEGESSDADEQRLREYFSSADVAAELQPYRSIFACLQYERNMFEAANSSQSIINHPSKIVRYVNWRYAVAAAVACLLTATFLVREFQQKPPAICTGTYVVINGVCYDDPALVLKHAAETIDMVIKPFGNGSAADALDFLD